MTNSMKNKLYSLMLTTIGIISVIPEPHDATALVLILVVSVPMFFSKYKWIL